METLKKEIIKCREYSKIYQPNFHSILQSNDIDSDSDNEFSSDVDHGKSNQIFLHQQKYFTQTFHISGFCVCRKYTSKYILENPQSKLCNIRKMEINHNDNNEKCAVKDDTTSDNSMIPIISPTSPKEGRKIVLINEKERPHNKYWIESE